MKLSKVNIKAALTGNEGKKKAVCQQLKKREQRFQKRKKKKTKTGTKF